MTKANSATESVISRKVLRLALFILLGIAVYSVGWYFAAEFIRKQIIAFMSGENPSAVVASCEDTTLGGYPFRFRLNCASVTIEDHHQGVSTSFGALRAAAQVYAPGHIIWELDGPSVTRSSLGFTSTVDWSSLQSSLVLATEGVDRSSVEVKDVTATVTAPASPGPVRLTAPHFESHVRRQEGNLDFASLIRDAQITLGSPDAGNLLELPPLSSSIDVTLTGKGALLDPREAPKQRLYGTTGQIRRFVTDLGEGRVMTISGPIAVGEDGLVSGQLNIEIEGLEGWATTAKQLYPEQGETIDDAMKVLAILFGGQNNGNAQLTIREGRVSLGLIPLGRLPPL